MHDINGGVTLCSGKGGGRHIIGFAAIRLGDWYYGGMNVSSVSDKFVAETCPDFRP